MGTHFKTEVERQRPKIHPLLRGIGFILFLLDLLVTSILTALFVPILAASGYAPLQVMGYVNFSLWIYRVPLLGNIAAFIHSINNLVLGIIVFFSIMLLLTAVISLIYVSFLQYMGPPRYGENDAPPPRYKAKKYKR